MLKGRTVQFIAFLQATGFVVYLILISFFFNFVTPSFNNGTAEFYAPIIMLLLFVLSAVISALLILGRSAVLFLNKDYRQSFELLGWTLVWGIAYFTAFIGLLYFE